MGNTTDNSADRKQSEGQEQTDGAPKYGTKACKEWHCGGAREEVTGANPESFCRVHPKLDGYCL